ncbi:lipid asymmetry maintenance protein MlaB [Superficieibacter sp.]|uniref:lipid asymmetry maintenance protein MlaB n=1 Tax=Superficieibacter sp. TaxID=2303322 RepID=UPI0028AB9C0B|nr:lipid asymmetry maintenance protein MlaB [Superficieibacter sp.]
MTPQLNWTRDGKMLSLHGELDQDVLTALWEARQEATQGVSVIELSGITRVDTAGLALLIHLTALIREQGRSVCFSGMSENLLTLTQLYNLPDELIPRAC